jgi:hypothetical protein
MRTNYRILCGLSLFLFIATSFMSIRSYFRGDYWGRSIHGRYNSVSSAKGSIVLDTAEMNPIFRPDETNWGTTKQVYYSTYAPPATLLERLGFWSIDIHTSAGPGFRTIIPYWPLIFLFAAIPANVLVRRTRRWIAGRRRIGLCKKCGYDLRASKDRCPECGMVVASGVAEAI